MLRRFNLLLILLLALAATGGAAWLFFDQRQTDDLIVAAGARSSEGFQLIEAIATVVNRHHPRIRIDVIETGGSLDNSQLMDAGYADLATFQADGNSSKRARLVATLYPDAYQLIARRSEGIENVADLKGKTVALPSKGSAQFTSFWYLANHYGLTEADINWLSMSNRSAEWALISDAVDAVFRVRAPGDATVKQLVEAADIALIPIEQAPALHLRKSSIHPGRIPRGSYRGHPPLPPRDLETASVDRLLVAATDVDENLIYEITTVLFERRRELSELSSLASLIAAPDMSSGTTLPLHDGAARYYDREKPSIWSEQADLLRTMLSLLAIFASMAFGFRNWFQGVQKNRADAYNHDLLGLFESARNREHDNAYYRNALGDILIRVINDLDNDRISRDGFDEFSFTWQAISQLLETNEEEAGVETA
jgi:TRAP transporter TAXI family solute receptor